MRDCAAKYSDFALNDEYAGCNSSLKTIFFIKG